jgi:hypothetical protein
MFVIYISSAAFLFHFVGGFSPLLSEYSLQHQKYENSDSKNALAGGFEQH